MSGYLLDTHVLVWMAMDPDRLSTNVLRSLDAAQGQLYVSPVSIWELSLLLSKRWFSLAASLPAWMRSVRERFDLNDVDLTWIVALEFDQVRLPHKDPADRLLVATARVHGLTLVTADRALLASRACPMLNAAAGLRRRPS